MMAAMEWRDPEPQMPRCILDQYGLPVQDPWIFSQDYKDLGPGKKSPAFEPILGGKKEVVQCAEEERGRSRKFRTRNGILSLKKAYQKTKSADPLDYRKGIEQDNDSCKDQGDVQDRVGSSVPRRNVSTNSLQTCTSVYKTERDDYSEARDVTEYGFCMLQNGEAKDYQLWVKSAKEDAPYPLFGE